MVAENKRLVKIGDTVRLKASNRKYSKLSQGEEYKVEGVEPNNGYWDGSSYITVLSDKNGFVTTLRMYENFFDIVSATGGNSVQNKKFQVGDKVVAIKDTPSIPEGWIGYVTAKSSEDYDYVCHKVGYENDIELFREHELELLSGGKEMKPKSQSALDKQVSGNHYKDCGIQPIEYIHANGLSYLEGNVIKYTTRHSKKNGKADIEKAIHYLELILEMEYKGETN